MGGVRDTSVASRAVPADPSACAMGLEAMGQFRAVFADAGD